MDEQQRPVTCTGVRSSDTECDLVSFQIVEITPELPGADRYLEIGFTSAAGALPDTAGRSGEINALVQNEGFEDFDQSNDYSYGANITETTPWDRVTVYRNGELVWGTEP
jgi:hypothetical protein